MPSSFGKEEGAEFTRRMKIAKKRFHPSLFLIYLLDSGKLMRGISCPKVYTSYLS